MLVFFIKNYLFMSFYLTSIKKNYIILVENRDGVVNMKKTYVVQLIIDAVVTFLGLCLYIFPNVADLGPHEIFSLTMGIYAGLELCEYIFDHSRKEPLFIFIAAAVASFASYFLRAYDANYVIPITVVVWIIFYAIIKMISLGEIKAKKSNLFIIRLVSMSMLIILGILVSINIFYRISSIGYVLALMFLSYGAIEAFCDFLTYLSEDGKFLKE